jgi:hypothetical protein
VRSGREKLEDPNLARGAAQLPLAPIGDLEVSTTAANRLLA